MIGIDFDNTIVSYDQVMHHEASQRGWIPADLPVAKDRVRDYMRVNGNEDDWTELQGYIYGPQMRDALPFPGVLRFLARCRRRRVSVCIISHKTAYPYQGPRYDLRRAAHEWLKTHGFYDPSRIGLAEEQVHFELTRELKLERIGAMHCTHFIDDLPEFLSDPTFPEGVERVLFDPNDSHPSEGRFRRAKAWADIAEIVDLEAAAPA